MPKMREALALTLALISGSVFAAPVSTEDVVPAPAFGPAVSVGSREDTARPVLFSAPPPPEAITEIPTVVSFPASRGLRGNLPSGESVAAIRSPEVVIPSHDEVALTLLEQMASFHEGITTASGEIHQVVFSSDFLEEIVSTGRFICRRPGEFRFDYDPSEDVGASTYWVNPQSIWIYIPELNQAEVIRNSNDNSIAKLLGNVLIGIDGAVENLRAENWITVMDATEADTSLGDDIVHLHLQPRDGVDTQGVTDMEVWIDQTALQPVQIKFVEETGDERTLTLTALSLNPALDAGRFDPRQTIPSDAVIEEY